MQLVKVKTPKLWVPPDQIWPYFGLVEPSDTPKVELWSAAEIIQAVLREPEKWQTQLAATKTEAKRLVPFVMDHLKWKWDPSNLSATNGMHGAVTHAAEVMVLPDGTHVVLYDKFHRTNGKPTGKFKHGIERGTPGAHTAPVIWDVKSRSWFLGFFMQYRPDLRWGEDMQGGWSASLSGGYGLGDPKALALDEMQSEFGLTRITDYEVLGYSNPDKAQWGDADALGVAKFRIEDVREILEQPDHEFILKARYLVRLNDFPSQLDQYDSYAVLLVQRYLSNRKG